MNRDFLLLLFLKKGVERGFCMVVASCQQLIQRIAQTANVKQLFSRNESLLLKVFSIVSSAAKACLYLCCLILNTAPGYSAVSGLNEKCRLIVYLFSRNNAFLGRRVCLICRLYPQKCSSPG